MGKLRSNSQKYVVVIDTSSPGLPVIIDGTEYMGGVSLKWDEYSRHTISVQKIVLSDEKGIRYVFESWNDGYMSPSRSIIVVENVTYTAIHKVQYYVQVETEYGDITGSDGMIKVVLLE